MDQSEAGQDHVGDSQRIAYDLSMVFEGESFCASARAVMVNWEEYYRMIERKYLDKAMSYRQYLDLLDDLLNDGKTTGADQSNAMVGYGKINRRRMERIDRTLYVHEGIHAAATKLDREMIWLILTEGWCGDAAQNIPVIEKIAAESVNILTRYLLRDQNHELMGAFLTHGARSIPKLIALDGNTRDVLGTWGARPKPAQDLFLELKRQGVGKAVMMEEIQRWYNADKGLSVQEEFEDLLRVWNVPVSEDSNP